MNRYAVNYLAVVVAAVAHFVLGAVWFTVLHKPWLKAIGKTADQLTGSPAPGYVVAFVSNLIIAWVLARIIIATGRTGVVGGVTTAAILWFGFTATTMGTALVFEGRAFEAFAVIAGYPLVGMLIIGAIVGGWPKRNADPNGAGEPRPT
jgi:Protein of unknown function (DUF1761)